MKFSIVSVPLVLLSSQIAFARDPSPKDILESADRSRSGVRSGMTWKVRVNSVESGNKTQYIYSVRTRKDDALVQVLEPAGSKGEVMLFNTRVIWFHKPGLSKPVAFSTRQRLTGQAANGDIASTYYSRDYNATLEGEEKINGRPAYVLNLVAQADDCTYDRIKYWVDKAKLVGVKAVFMNADGQPIKSAEFQYGNKLKVGGEVIDFVKTIRIVNANKATDYSTLTYTNPVPKVQDAADFAVNQLAR
jgi:negative regulator of sigma E activity